MKKYLELFKDGFDTTVEEKRKVENGPYVAYSTTGEVVYTVVPKNDKYEVTYLKYVTADELKNTEYQVVDLGLPSGTKWLDRNIGAKTVDDCGAYFSWGNTDGYAVSGTKFLTVDEACQLFSGVTGVTVTTKEELENMLSQMGITVDNIGIVDGYSFDKATYNGTSGAGFTGDVLDSTHDAATSIMGDSWRMPTIDEYKELVNAVKTSEEDNENPLTCTYIYLDKQGNKNEYIVYRENTTDYFNISLPEYSVVLGIKFTNTSTDASVYFPACGSVGGSLLVGIGFCGLYWSSSIDVTTNARIFFFDPDAVIANISNARYCGLCVRAVK
jgi:hypothetical protein